MRKLLTTSTAIAMLAAITPAASAQEAPAELIAAYETYAAARLGISDDASAAAAADARANLEDICSSLGTPDLAACLDQYVPAELRIPGDTDPLPEVSEEAQPDAAPEPAVEAEAEAEAEAQPETEVEPEPAPEEPVTEEEAPSEQQPDAAETTAQPEQPVDEQQSSESQSAETAEEAAPATEPEPQPDVQEASPELTATYEAYATARLNLAGADLSTAEGAAQLEAATTARTDLENICAELGTPDLAACLDQYISPEMRVPGDTEPLPEPSGEAEPEQAPQPETAPEEVEEDLQSEAGEEQGEPAGDTTTETGETAEPVDDADIAREDIAPVLDSAKEQQPATEEPTAAPEEQAIEAEAETEAQAEAETSAEQQTAPESDAAAQTETISQQQVESIEAEEGEAVTAESEAETSISLHATPPDAQVVQQDESGFRVIFQFGDQYVLQNSDRPRLLEDASDRYVERLRDGRWRETIERPNGSRVVTVYNRNGDILRRSRITPDGREYVLYYVDETHYDDTLEWYDPAEDLPPLRLNIPTREYILDAEEADEEEVVRFLEQPPVERVQRLYSVDEVKRSARIRDMVRRLEVGDLTFDTGSAVIGPDQIGSLNKVARAMQELLEDNPGETFLIEGHTDAVGSDISNLDLSDRRAETVAIILSEYFDIPPENLATQGYGERYLKIRTEEPERLNRRVTIKRITPLVAPVAAR